MSETSFQIKCEFKKLPRTEQKILLEELRQLTDQEKEHLYQQIQKWLISNIGESCVHCGSKQYIGWGKDKGIQRYKCKTCGRTFTEYSGTWISHLHRKDLVDDYINLFLQEYSISRIANTLGISIQTAFDWRHKFLSAIETIDENVFTGITETDETFFLYSEKGTKQEKRKARKRGGAAKKKGISDEQVAVLVTTDRKQSLDLRQVTMGRLSKQDIEKAIGTRISKDTILCSDAHVSIKGFAIDHELEHHTIKASLNEHVKDKVYHVQHVNSMDSRLKTWIDRHFKGVATKYLQKYLNWFKFKELLRTSTQRVYDYTLKSMLDNNAWSRFKDIKKSHEQWKYNHAILE